MAIVRLAYKLEDGLNLIDLAQGLSITERRLIRQKQVFTVMGGAISDGAYTAGGGNSAIKISTAPNNFYTRNAVTRGFRAWKAMRKKVLETETSIIPAKYADFKVLLDESASGYYRRPMHAGSVPMTAGEWDYSDMTADNPAPDDGTNQTRVFHIVGNQHTNSRYCLSLGWLQTRAAPQVEEPNMPDLNGDGNEDINVDFITTLFQDTNESVLRADDVVDEGDVPPFARLELMTTQSAYSASEPNNCQLQFFVNPKNDDLHVPVPGFQALCGLIRVDVGSDYTNPILILDVETKGWSF